MRAERARKIEPAKGQLYLVDSDTPVARPKRKKRRTPRWMKVITAILGLYLLFLFAKNGYDIWQLKRQMTILEQEQARLAELHSELEKELESLNDPEVIEKKAREDLGMVREGETVIIPAVPGHNIPRP
ncbi:MAG: septum formation initiator family protein [Peptococcia bacterium]